MGKLQSATASAGGFQPSSSLPGRADTKERLLDASELLFAERGFEGTSMRAVTQAAGASLSAANYHFGSKEELLRAVLRRRIEPINQGRLERLSLAEKETSDRPVSLEAIFEAFIRPVFETQTQPEDRQLLMRHVAARLFADPPEVVAALKAELMGEVTQRFEAAIARALPAARPARHSLVLQLTVGLIVHVLSGQLSAWPAAESSAPGAPPDPDREELIETLVRYAAAGAKEAS